MYNKDAYHIYNPIVDSKSKVTVSSDRYICATICTVETSTPTVGEKNCEKKRKTSNTVHFDKDNRNHY